MSRHHRTRARRHTSHMGAAGAFVLFLVFALLLGGIAATTPVPDGVVGFLVLVVGLLIWGGSGSRHGGSYGRRR